MKRTTLLAAAGVMALGLGAYEWLLAPASHAAPPPREAVP